MDLFSLAKVKPSPELELMISIKYGEPKPTESYANSLPKVVLERLRKDALPFYPKAEFWRDEDLIYYVQSSLNLNPEYFSRLIKDTLLKYHAMLGHV